MSTRIEWADESWNPCTGCTPVSEGCENCYAERVAGRFKPCAMCSEGWRIDEGRDCDPCELSFAPRFHPDRLDAPLHWRKPRRIFACSMSDLFHEAFTDEQRDEVFAVMALAGRHTFMVPTKRPGRMHRYMLDRQPHVAHTRHAIGRQMEATWSRSQLLTVYGRSADEWDALEAAWPLPNLWLGVTVENQARADERIPILLGTPAAMRFMSIEPMLGPVDLTSRMPHHYHVGLNLTHAHEPMANHEGVRWSHGPHLDWVILGGETGPGARPMQPEWALDVYRQCKAAGVPFFFKQWGARHSCVACEAFCRCGTCGEMQTFRELPGVTP